MQRLWICSVLFCLFSLCTNLQASCEARSYAIRDMLVRDIATYNIRQSDLTWLWGQTLPGNKMCGALHVDAKEVIKHLESISHRLKKPKKVASSKENIAKNGNTSSFPFDETRTLRHLPGFYLNASDIMTPWQEYIASEAPMTSTLNDFWYAVMERDVRTIVALALPRLRSSKYPSYWQEPMLPYTCSRSLWTIRKVQEELVERSTVVPDQAIVKTLLSASDGKNVRMLTHFHYVNWPDNGPPAPDLFYKLLQIVDKEQTKSQHPILVHCIAGIGRSGTFVTAHSLMKDLQKNPQIAINIPLRIVELRLQRQRMVASATQVEAIYGVVRKIAKSVRLSTAGNLQHGIHKEH